MTPFFCFWRNQIKISAIYDGSRRCHKRRHWSACFRWQYLVGSYRKRFNYRSHISIVNCAKLRLEDTENKLKLLVKERNDKASLCRRMSHSTTTITTIIIIINNNNNKSTFLTSQQFSWFSKSMVLTEQVLLIHCSAKKCLIIRHVFSFTAFCTGMYRAGRKLSSHYYYYYYFYFYFEMMLNPAWCLLGIGFKLRHAHLVSLLRIFWIRLRPERVVSKAIFLFFTSYY